MSPSHRAKGSALMVALFVIVVMALLAAALGRLLADSEEKNTVEVRSVRALMAAQSALEVGLYRLYPSGQWQLQACPSKDVSFDDIFEKIEGLVGCRATLSCEAITSELNGAKVKGIRLIADGSCGDLAIDSPSAEFAVSRRLVVETYGVDGL